MWYIFIGLIVGVVLVLPIIALSSHEREKEVDFIENHKKIYPGMPKTQVLNLMGPNYTQSILKSGIEKLEWRYRHAGYTGRVAKGSYVHVSSLTRKISVKFKDGVVVEVNALNMD
jgi:hypothetical protein